MLNKPIRIKKLAAFAMAVTFWMFTGSVFAQSTAQPEMKQAPQRPVKENITLKSTKANPKSEAEQKRVAAEQSRASEVKAAEMMRKEELAKNEATQKNLDVPNEWAAKKKKLVADLKAKGYSDDEITKEVASVERELNINNQFSTEQSRQNEMMRKAEMEKNEAAQKQSISSKAPQSEIVNPSNQKSESTTDVQKSWAVKKLKLEADLKAKGYSDYEINREVISIEEKMNLNNQTTK